MDEMTYRQLGRSGLSVSTMGLGCNNFGMRLDESASRAVIEAALDCGITFFDTSDSYGASEEFLGRALSGRRDDVVVATKFGSALKGAIPGDRGARGSRSYIVRAVERSLRRLATDYIDLYQMHYPDPSTPIEETLSALTQLVRQGKVRYLGSSNVAAWQVVDADHLARAAGLERFTSVQNEYSLLDRRMENELVPAALHLGIGVLPYFPLASGVLTGKYQRDSVIPADSRIAAWGLSAMLTPDRFVVLDKLRAYAADRGVGLLDVALGGLAAQPGVSSVIAGATSAEQVRSNVAAGGWRPSLEDLQALDGLLPRGGTV